MCVSKVNIILLIVVVALVISGCRRDRRDFVVAKAGKTELSADELDRIIPEGFENRMGEGAFRLVEDWTEEALLAEAARDLGLDKRDDIAYRLDEARRMILAAAFEREIVMQGAEVDSAEIYAYYKDHVDEIIRERDEVRCIHIMVADSTMARAVEELLDSVEFEELAGRYSLDPEIGGMDYYAGDEMHPKLAKIAFALPEGGVAGPIETEFGYHFIKLLDFAPKGSIREFEVVRESIRDILLDLRFREAYARIIDSLATVKGVTIDSVAIRKTIESDE